MTARTRGGRRASGLTGLFAFFLQLLFPGPTLDFKSVGDTFQAEDANRRRAPSTALAIRESGSESMGDMGPVETRYTKRYRERSRFDSRGAIVDLRG